uniref:Glycerol-3-phosphate dehydrogenase [NAD(+)] n=1 Tax=Syphacia muris TaxID=451379 RepID=A0A0N5AWE8_9BILA
CLHKFFIKLCFRGSAIACVIGKNAAEYPDYFGKDIKAWIFDEDVNGKKLSEIVNTEHENVKYLPGIKIPSNVTAVPDIIQACKDADILVFVVPHQFVENVCKKLGGNVKPTAVAITLTKGLLPNKEGGIRLVSEEIKKHLKIEVSVLMGANLAKEVANNDFCEATIGCSDSVETGMMWKRLFHTENFQVTVVDDVVTVELCGALKNIIACAAGLSDGLGHGDNTKSAIIRLGFIEVMKFVECFYNVSNIKIFFESCGIADLIASCIGGRNLFMFIKPFPEVEKEVLKGQSAQGPMCAAEAAAMIKKAKLEAK